MNHITGQSSTQEHECVFLKGKDLTLFGSESNVESVSACDVHRPMVLSNKSNDISCFTNVLLLL